MKTITLAILTLLAWSCGGTQQPNKSEASLKSGFNQVYVDCQSTDKTENESVSVIFYSRAAPGGPVSEWTEFKYSQSNQEYSAFLERTHEVGGFKLGPNGVEVYPYSIFTGYVAGNIDFGYVHVHANSATREVYLDVDIQTNPACPSTDCNTSFWGNTNGLRRLTGFECTTNFYNYTI